MKLAMQFSLIAALKDIPIACIDLETTGASAEFGHRVIEVGIVRYENGKKIAEYQQLVDPRRRIDPGVSAMTGISQAMCDGQPSFADQFDAMCAILSGAIVLGHNIRFDLSFLNREFRKCGKEIERCLENAPVLDTVRIARRRFGRGGNSLGNLARRLGYEPPIAHRALPDAETTAIVFDRMLQPIGGWDLFLCDAMQHQGGPMNLLPVESRQPTLPLELEEALEQRRPVMMEYLDANQFRTQRVIDPIQILRRNGELILIAHCHLRADRRTFKIERIVGMQRIEPVDQPLPSNVAAPEMGQTS
ncbi:MAG: exonuclease domain-containing protein [Tepidisphaeraceae bacterium]|jgi:DNA polymerase III epsilon subunit family exonuclease